MNQSLTRCWPASIANQSGLVTLTFDLESGVRVMCAVGYLCANFSLPRPLCSRLRPDVCNRQTDIRRQTDVKQKHRFMPSSIRGGGIITTTMMIRCKFFYAERFQTFHGICIFYSFIRCIIQNSFGTFLGQLSVISFLARFVLLDLFFSQVRANK